jgi:hypothetical protein
MLTPARSEPSSYTLLRAQNLRLGDRRSAHPWLQEDADNEDDQEAYLFWESLLPEAVDSGTTRPALWELLRMAEASARDIKDFTARWGMLSGDWDVDGYGDRYRDDYGEYKAGALAVSNWRDFAAFVGRLLSLLVLTSQEEVIDLRMLESMQGWEEPSELPEFALPKESEDIDSWVRRLSADSVADAFVKLRRRREERRWQDLLAEREAGKGVEQQRRLLSLKLSDLLGMQYGHFRWDERGRRIEREAIGLDEIVFSNIAALFLSHDIDVLICSVCGMPYPFDETAQGRRPRFGVRRFCSEACRIEGKRESNRLAWRRNSATWRRNARGSKKEGSNGETG